MPSPPRLLRGKEEPFMNKLATLGILVLLAACAGDPPPDRPATSSSADTNSPRTAGIGRNGGIDHNNRSGNHTDAQRAQLQSELGGGAGGAGDRVFFLTDRSELTPEAQQILGRQAAFMRQYPNLTFTIEGHADERGTREYNLALGDRRASTVRKFLVSSGIAENRMRTVSYGKEKPVVAISNDQGWAQNRRAVTVID
jgi:peptidoglycan-associated lipoprotein